MALDALRDLLDIARRARSPRELLLAAAPGLAEPIVLNERREAESADERKREPAELVRGLRRARNALEAHLHDGRVDYARLRDSDAFAELAASVPALRAVEPAALPTDADKTAFFIDLYNVLAIHGVLALDLRDSVMEMPSFFGRVSYRVGPATLSLDQIENGVLRRNRAHPATRRPTLSAEHPGLAFCPSAVDPRIHAALVCASASCPPVGLYEPERLDEQLTLAARSYVGAEAQVEADAVRLPITFRYYAEDWGDRAAIEAFLLAHADGAHQGALRAAFEAGLPFRYDRYDWSLNIV